MALCWAVRFIKTPTFSPKSISDHHGLLSALLKTAVAEGLIDVNPCAATRLPRAGEELRRDERYLTHEEYAAIEAHMRGASNVALVRLEEGPGIFANIVDVAMDDLAIGQQVVAATGERNGRPVLNFVRAGE